MEITNLMQFEKTTMTAQDNVQKMKDYIFENFIKKDPYMLKTYKQRRNDFKKSFRDTIAENSPLISDYSCAIYAGTPKILQQGRMYVTSEYVCFYSRFLTFEQKLTIPFKSINELTKEKTAMVFQNAIQIVTGNNEKSFFSSFTTRDRAYQVIHKIWKENKDEYKLTNAAFWDRVRENYGNDLGFLPEDPEMDESNATQFTARYVIPRRPSEIMSNTSSPEDSVYESFEESPVSDNGNDFPVCNGHISKSDSYVNKPSPILEEEIKFDLPFRNSIQLQDNKEIKNISQENIQRFRPPAVCSGHDHLATVLMDEEFSINVTTLWSLIFTDHAFFRALCAIRFITDITQSNWSDDIDIGKEQCRTIYYTVNLKNRIGPKKSPTVEKQVLLDGSCKDYIYYLESTVRTVGIPMSDSFHVVLRYCILYINPNKSRIKISMKVEYDKAVFFATKSIIDSTVKSGCIDYHKDLKQALKIESQKMNENITEQKSYCPQTSIEDSYQGSVNDSNEIESISTSSKKSENETKISWMMMVIICCISFFMLYIVKEMYSDSSAFLELNDHNERYSQREFDHDSLTEIMKIIKEMKTTIDILKLNIEMLNRSQNCS